MSSKKTVDLKCLYQSSSKQNRQTKQEIFEEFLKEHSTNRNVCDIDSLKERLRTKPLLLEKSMLTKNGWQKKKKKKKIHFGRKAAKTLGLYKIKKEDQKYEKFLPLHQLWMSYIQDVFMHKYGTIQIHADERILKVDYHGAIIVVKNCKCKSFVGLSGIVMKETKNMFDIITVANELKSIPKRDTLFCLTAHGHKITIYGNAIVGRPAERMVKKLKRDYTSEMILEDS